MVLLNEPGPDGLKKMIEGAKRTRRDNGVFELSWTNSGVVVTANVKIVGQRPLPAGAAAAPNTGFKRLKLPESIIATLPAAATTVAVGGAL